MKFVVGSDKSVDAVVQGLRAAAVANGCRVLNVHDLRATLGAIDQQLPRQCRIVEMCDPALTVEMLNRDMSLNLALPCRISVYEDDGHTQIALARPTDMMEALSQSPTLRDAAKIIEQRALAMIERAR